MQQERAGGSTVPARLHEAFDPGLVLQFSKAVQPQLMKLCQLPRLPIPLQPRALLLVLLLRRQALLVLAPLGCSRGHRLCRRLLSPAAQAVEVAAGAAGGACACV
jgi:hypothetical protein